MKKVIQSTFVLLAILAASPVSAQQEMLFTNKGYPYKPLVNRADEVKIIYTESKDNVMCEVVVTIDGVNHKGQRVSVTGEDFAKAPLASCLQRQTAKQMLATTFTLS